MMPSVATVCPPKQANGGFDACVLNIRGACAKCSLELRSWLLPVSLYLVASSVMTLANKYAVSVLKFPGINLVLLVECAFTALAIAAWRPQSCNPLRPEILRNLLVVTLAKAGNMVFSMICMQYTSLPVYNVLKRLYLVFSATLDFLLRGTHFSIGVLASIILITCGALVTGAGDLEFDPLGYILALPAALMHASYLVLSARAADRVPGLTHVDVLFYTAFYNLFVFAPLSLAELSAVNLYFAKEDTQVASTLGVLSLYVVLGTLLNYVTFWCTTATSPVTTGVTGNLKAILTTWFGFAWFGSELTSTGWFGLALSSCGGVLYSSLKAMEAQRHNVKKST